MESLPGWNCVTGAPTEVSSCVNGGEVLRGYGVARRSGRACRRWWFNASGGRGGVGTSARVLAETKTDTIECWLYPQVLEGEDVAIGVYSIRYCGMEVAGAASGLSDVILDHFKVFLQSIFLVVKEFDSSP